MLRIPQRQGWSFPRGGGGRRRAYHHHPPEATSAAAAATAPRHNGVLDNGAFLSTSAKVRAIGDGSIPLRRYYNHSSSYNRLQQHSRGGIRQHHRQQQRHISNQWPSAPQQQQQTQQQQQQQHPLTMSRGGGGGGPTAMHHHHHPPPQQQHPPQPSPPRLEEKIAGDSQVWGLMFGRFLLAAGLYYGTTEYVADVTMCEGPSMSPTIYPSGEIVLIDKLSLRICGGVQYGCVGTDRAAAARKRQEEYERQKKKNTKKNNKGEEEDEEVFWHEDRISVSDLPPLRSPFAALSQLFRQICSPLRVGDVVVVNHPYRKGTICKRVLGLPGDQVLSSRGLLQVPDGHVWIEGDNPAESLDSREYGPIPAALIVGRVPLRLWPLRGDAVLRRGAPPNERHRNDDEEEEEENAIIRHFLPLLGAGRNGRRRGGRPIFQATSMSGRGAPGSIVLPAGYEGEHIIKHASQQRQRQRQRGQQQQKAPPPNNKAGGGRKKQQQAEQKNKEEEEEKTADEQ